MVRVQVRNGDVRNHESDGLIVVMGSGELFVDATDGAIQKVADELFDPPVNGKALPESGVVYAPSEIRKGSRFGGALFVIADEESSLSDLLEAGFRGADSQHLNTVTVPMLRTGIMSEANRQSVKDAMNEMVAAVRRFIAAAPSSVQYIRFVVFGDPDGEAYLKEAFGLA